MKVTTKIARCFKSGLRVFHRSCKGVSLNFHGRGSSKDVSRVFPECFNEVSRKLSRCVKKVSCCMALMAASRAQGGHVLATAHKIFVNLGKF